uniref:DUF4347 domain-containing protein n=1 Tax=Panagrellus redivivus TaxID=6233 RepID=A0A7E4VL20_PANRE
MTRFDYNNCYGCGQDELWVILGALHDLALQNDTGYRTNISNHLIVYATVNEIADDAAVIIANGIIRNGTYNIAAVTYESNGNNTQSLTALVGGKPECVITAADYDDLTVTAAEKLASLIWKASNNNGNYC